MAPPSDFGVMIVGRGIGGLCLGQGLPKSAVNVSVFERDSSGTDRLGRYRLAMNPAGIDDTTDQESRDRHGVTYRRGEQSGRVQTS